MGKSRHVVSLLVSLLLLGCASTSPIKGRRYADLAVRADDNTFLAARQPDDLRYGKYALVERFPNPANVTAGMPSRIAFESLGKATGIMLDMTSYPPAQMAMRSSQDVAIEWRITLFWALARLQPGERIETADIGVSFVKLTRTKDEIPYVGNPLFRDLDTGWFVEQVNVLPVLHSLKPPPKGR